MAGNDLVFTKFEDIIASGRKYNIIYADPPWTYTLWNVPLNMPHATNRPVRMASAFYNTMKDDDLYNIPVNKITDKNCALFLWVTSPLLQQGLDLIKSWKFEYKTIAFVWVKINPGSSKVKLGLGNYTRPSAEICLLAMKGSLKKYKRNVYQVQYSEVREHSRKPDKIRNEILKLFGHNVPKIELFARHKIPGWDAFGNQIDQAIQPLQHYF